MNDPQAVGRADAQSNHRTKPSFLGNHVDSSWEVRSLEFKDSLRFARDRGSIAGVVLETGDVLLSSLVKGHARHIWQLGSFWKILGSRLKCLIGNDLIRILRLG